MSISIKGYFPINILTSTYFEISALIPQSLRTGCCNDAEGLLRQAQREPRPRPLGGRRGPIDPHPRPLEGGRGPIEPRPRPRGDGGPINYVSCLCSLFFVKMIALM